MACDSVSAILGLCLPLMGSDSGFRARQNFFTGQIWQRGLRTVQTRAPRSIRADWNFRGARAGMICRAVFHSFLRLDAESIRWRRLSTRARTRAVLASTMGRERLKAKTITAFAV